MSDPNCDSRLVWIDWLRVLACFLVMVVHSTEPFYLGGDGSLILTRADLFWASLTDSFARACVPLFIVASSYLQFPVRYSTGEFFKRRAARILIPFAVWSLAYAFAWGEPVENLKDLALNFNYAAGHLWFVYMLVGLYLIMPLLSPWAEKVGRMELLIFMVLCFFTSAIPFIRESASNGEMAMMYGPSGIPMGARYPLWGEASWNDFGTFYYLSGFIGYLLLGLYLRRFGGEPMSRRNLAVAIPCWICGFAIAFYGFVRRALASLDGAFPIEGGVDLATIWETPWTYNSVGIVLMTVGWILAARRWKAEGAVYRHVILPVSKAGYGIYLSHMFALASFSSLFRGWLGIGTDGLLGILTTPLEILLTAVCSFVSVSFICVLIKRIPKIGRYIIG